MEDEAMVEAGETAVDMLLQQSLRQADADMAGSTSVLRHLIAGTPGVLFADDIVATARGLMHDMARQLVDELRASADAPAEEGTDDTRSAELFGLMLGDEPLLRHVHSLAIEARFGEWLEADAGIDQVLTPVLQDLAASKTGSTSALTMALIAAQARFVQQQRRMELPIGELPGELYHRITQLLTAFAADSGEAVKATRKRLRSTYDEARSRLGLLSRLVSGISGEEMKCLRIDKAGLALFATGLSALSEQSREAVLLAAVHRPAVRLLLSLRAAGAPDALVYEQLARISPASDLTQAWFSLSRPEAAAWLSRNFEGQD